MNDYPPAWKSGAIQRAMYARAGWHCEHCGMPFLPGTTKAANARKGENVRREETSLSSGRLGRRLGTAKNARPQMDWPEEAGAWTRGV